MGVTKNLLHAGLSISSMSSECLFLLCAEEVLFLPIFL